MWGLLGQPDVENVPCTQKTTNSFVMYLIDFIHPIAGELKDKLAGLDRSGHGVVRRERVGHRLPGRGFLSLVTLPGPHPSAQEAL